MPGPQQILEYWFGEGNSPKQQIITQSNLWWGKSTDTDADIKLLFGATLQLLIENQLEGWRKDSSSLLAMIILGDQFSRNIFRNDARAFAQDALVLSLCLDGIEQGADQELSPLQRVFFYLPLEHSESLEMQQRCVDLMTHLVAIAPSDCREEFQGFLAYARAHLEVIEVYGRFPHRNAILKRESTAAEQAYLSQPDAGF